MILRSSIENSTELFFSVEQWNSTFAVAIKLQRRVKASAQHSKTSLTLRSPCTSLALAIRFMRVASKNGLLDL